MAEKRFIGEIGQTGTEYAGRGIQSTDWLNAFIWPSLGPTVDRIRADAIVGAIENGYYLPVKQANYSIAYDDHDKNMTDTEKLIYDFWGDQFTNLNMSNILGNACLAIGYGFYMFEPVYTLKKGLIYASRLSPRLPGTVFQWHVDDHGLLKGITQMVQRPQNDGLMGIMEYPYIPAEKLIVITHKLEGGDYQGRSEYRPIYREWLAKDRTFKQLMITIERVGGGIPTALMEADAPQDGPNTKGAASKVEDVLRGLQGSESAYMVLEKVKSLDLLSLPPEAITKMMDLIKYCDEAIAKAAFQMFMNLGTSSSGSRALGDTFESLYYEALYSIGEEICSALNQQFIRRLTDWNFGPQLRYPKIRLNFQQNMSFILRTVADLKSKGLIAGNTEIENFAMDWFGLPLTTKENKLAPTPAQIIPALPPVAASDSCGCGKEHGLTMSEGKKRRYSLNRQLTDRESACWAFDETLDALENIHESAAIDLRKVVEPAVMEAAKEIGKKKIFQIDINWGNKVADVIRKNYRRMYDVSKDLVRKDLQKQAKKMTDALAFYDRLAMNANKYKKPSDAWDEWYNEQSDIGSEILRSNVKEAFSKYASAGIDKGLTGAELSTFIIDQFIKEAGQRYETAAGRITGAYSMVREMTTEEFQDVIVSKQRVEAMDSNTCEYCRGMDGKTYTKQKDGSFTDESGEEAVDLPDTECEGEMGGHKCRAIYLYEVAE